MRCSWCPRTPRIWAALIRQRHCDVRSSSAGNMAGETGGHMRRLKLSSCVHGGSAAAVGYYAKCHVKCVVAHAVQGAHRQHQVYCTLNLAQEVTLPAPVGCPTEFACPTTATTTLIQVLMAQAAPNGQQHQRALPLSPDARAGVQTDADVHRQPVVRHQHLRAT